MEKWQVQEAKAKFSEMVQKAKKEPQHITYRGEEIAVLVSIEEYNKITKNNKPSFVELMRNSPFLGEELEIERDKSMGRDIEL